MNRGDHSQAIFLDDPDRPLFLKTPGEVGAKTGGAIHAYGLMKKGTPKRWPEAPLPTAPNGA